MSSAIFAYGITSGKALALTDEERRAFLRRTKGIESQLADVWVDRTIGVLPQSENDRIVVEVTGSFEQPTIFLCVESTIQQADSDVYPIEAARYAQAPDREFVQWLTVRAQELDWIGPRFFLGVLRDD
jgi:hypothetical protein